MIGMTSSYGATRNAPPRVTEHRLTRLAVAVLRERLVIAKTMSATNTEGTAATTTQWTRPKRGALAIDEVRTAALESGDTPLLKQVFETTVLVTYLLEKFRVRLTFKRVTLTAVTAAYESFATIEMIV